MQIKIRMECIEVDKVGFIIDDLGNITEKPSDLTINELMENERYEYYKKAFLKCKIAYYAGKKIRIKEMNIFTP